jgi:prepilin-type processing-associated H-X9-DG protein
MLANYMPNNKTWVCPKRKRGITYPSYAPQTGDFDPSLTGLLSYGFNNIKVFGGVDPAIGNMAINRKFKAAMVTRPSLVVAVADSAGAWFDTWWAGNSGATTTDVANIRMQGVNSKHNKRINFLYVDGHAAAELPSRLYWGQFWDYHDSSAPTFGCPGGNSRTWNQAVSTPAIDNMQIPEP